MRTTGKPDANAADLVELWRAAGGKWDYMPPATGFDGLAAFQGKLHVVEIKDGSLSPSQRALTQNERMQQDGFLAHGVPYTIWECEADVLRMITKEPEPSSRDNRIPAAFVPRAVGTVETEDTPDVPGQPLGVKFS